MDPTPAPTTRQAVAYLQARRLRSDTIRGHHPGVDTQKTRTGICIAVLTVSLGLTPLVACSGSDEAKDRTPAGSQWAAGADEVCADAATLPVPMPPGAVGDVALASDQDRELLVGIYREGVVNAREMVDELQGLDASDKEQSALLAAVEADVVLLEQAVENFDTTGPGQLALAGARLRMTADAVADELGLDACNGLLGLWSDGTTPEDAPLQVDVVCFKDPDFLDNLSGPEAGLVDTSSPVVCEEPHDAETYLTFEARPVAGTEYPGQVALAEQAAAQCSPSFEDAVGVAAISDPGNYLATIPDAEGWESGQRQSHRRPVRPRLAGNSSGVRDDILRSDV